MRSPARPACFGLLVVMRSRCAAQLLRARRARPAPRFAAPRHALHCVGARAPRPTGADGRRSWRSGIHDTCSGSIAGMTRRTWCSCCSSSGTTYDIISPALRRTSTCATRLMVTAHCHQGLKRRRRPGVSSSRAQAAVDLFTNHERLRPRDIRWSLLFLVGVPYLRTKARDAYERLGGGIEADLFAEPSAPSMSTSDVRPRSRPRANIVAAAARTLGEADPGRLQAGVPVREHALRANAPGLQRRLHIREDGELPTVVAVAQRRYPTAERARPRPLDCLQWH